VLLTNCYDGVFRSAINAPLDAYKLSAYVLMPRAWLVRKPSLGSNEPVFPTQARHLVHQNQFHVGPLVDNCGNQSLAATGENVEQNVEHPVEHPVGSDRHVENVEDHIEDVEYPVEYPDFDRHDYPDENVEQNVEHHVEDVKHPVEHPDFDRHD